MSKTIKDRKDSKKHIYYFGFSYTNSFSINAALVQNTDKYCNYLCY